MWFEVDLFVVVVLNMDIVIGGVTERGPTLGIKSPMKHGEFTFGHF
jgi:hypothetical protein